VTQPDLTALQDRLKTRFRDPELLLQALTHSSFAHEHPDGDVADNERLEFLGDAVIHLLAADMLYRRDAAAAEGALTLERAAMVSTGALAELARAVDLGPELRLGRGLDRGGGRDQESLLANAFEAVMGAIFLDRGMVAARSCFTALAGSGVGGPANYKGRFQELTQADGVGVPHYRVVSADGPSHRRQYTVEVRLSGVRLGVGEGSTRRAAEQEAAREGIAAFEATRTNLAEPAGATDLPLSPFV
jgi:ribonuclease-3